VTGAGEDSTPGKRDGRGSVPWEASPQFEENPTKSQSLGKYDTPRMKGAIVEDVPADFKFMRLFGDEPDDKVNVDLRRLCECETAEKKFALYRLDTKKYPVFAWPNIEAQTPSVLAGMAVNLEVWYRLDTCDFISLCCEKMGQGRREVKYTAWSYFNRFFNMHDFQSHDRFVVAIAALFLAGKSKDGFKPIRRLVYIWRGAHNTYIMGSNKKPSDLSPDCAEYKKRCQDIFTYERAVIDVCLYLFLLSCCASQNVSSGL